MREVLLLTPAEGRRLPWRNGRGFTTELALWPTGARFEDGAFEWRISRAAVDEAGPFSVFPGYERILLVTSGAGLILAHAECAPRARLRPLEPYRFSGDWPTTAELVAGRVEDFNVLALRGSVEASVQAQRLGRRRLREALGAAHTFVHVLSGSADARVTGEEQPFDLGAGASLWARGPGAADELELTGRSDDCAVLIVTLQPSP